MPTVLIVENNSPDLVAQGKEGAAGFRRCFARIAPGLQARTVQPYVTPLHPDDLADVDGVVFTGAGVPWGVDAAEAAPLREAMELCFQHALPVWGSCNGMQLGALVLGGRVGAGPNGLEIGVARDLAPTDIGKTHPMLAGRKSGYSVPCVHFHEVLSLGSTTTLLASNAHTRHQAIACQSGGVSFWGTQYHSELMLSDIADYARAGGGFGDDPALVDLLERADVDPAAAQTLGTSPSQLGEADRELRNWLAYIDVAA